MPTTNYAVRFEVQNADSARTALQAIAAELDSTGAAANRFDLTNADSVRSDLANIAASLRSAGEAAEEMSAKQTRALNSLISRLDPAVKDTQRFEQGLATLNTGLAAGALSAEDHGRYIDLLSERYTEAGRATAAQEAAIEAFRASLESTSATTRVLADETERLNSWLSAGKITAEEHASGIAQLHSRIAAMDGAIQSVTSASSRPWWMDSNVTRNWVDVVQVLAASGGDLSLAIPTMIDAADVTKYYYDQNTRAAAAANDLGEAASAASRSIDTLADDTAAAAIAADSVAGSAAQASSLFSGLNVATVGLYGSIGLATAAVAAFGAAWLVHSNSVEEAEQTQKLYGNTLGITSAQLEDLAQRAADAGNISVLAARDMADAYTATRKIGAEAMAELISLSRDYASVTEQDLAEANAELADMFADPAQAAKELTDRYGLLSAATLAHVQALANQGRQQDAIIIVADALKARIKGMADETNDFAAAWNRVWNAVKNTFDAMGKMPMAETNAQALERLYKAQTELVKAQAAAASKFTEESGGAAIPSDWVPSAGGFTDRSGATIGAVTTAAAQASTQLEVINRQAALIAEEWAAAEAKRISAEQAAGREAAVVVQGLNPALGQINDYNAMLGKLTAVQGAVNADLDAQTGAAIAATTKRVTAARDDLQLAVDLGKSLDQVKADATESMYAKAAGMEASARQKFMAEESARISLIGTATTAEERATVVRQAGAAVVSQQSTAIADQTAAMNQMLVAAQATADAYGESEAAGLRMEAMQRALAEAVSLGAGEAWASVEAAKELATVYAEEQTGNEQRLSQLQAEVATTEALAEAASLSVAAYQAEYNHQLAIEEVRKRLVAADALQQQYQAQRNAGLITEQQYQTLLAGLDEKRKKTAESRKGIEDTLNEKTYKDQQLWLSQQLTSQSSAVSYAQTELSLVGASADQRALILARLQAENTLKQQGVTYSNDQTKAYVDNAVALERINQEMEKATASFEEFPEDDGECARFFSEVIGQ